MSADSAMLDLYVEEKVLGSESRFFREAGVRFGRLAVGKVADNDLPLPIRHRADRGKRRFDAVRLSVELEQLEHGQYYIDARLRLAFDQPDVFSVLYYPSENPPLEADVELTPSAPGLSEFGWRLTGRSQGAAVRAGGREFRAVMEAPLTAQELTGTMDARVRFVKRTMRVPTTKEAEPKEPLRFTLDLQEGTFAYLSAQ
jgi:hypothetical protein